MAMTPEQWLAYLAEKLVARQPQLTKLQKYYDGDHPLPEGPKKATEKFIRFQREARTNWTQLIVDATAERLQVVGFKFSEDTDGDTDVWKSIWQANQLDADHKLVQCDALTLGVGYVLVWPYADHPAGVRITPESATQCVVAYETGERRKRAAGLKVWCGPDGYLYATLYLPGLVYTWVSRTKQDALLPGGSSPTSWVARVVEGEPWPQRLDVEDVMLVELRPRPKLDGCGRSELDGLTDIQDRINSTIFGRLVAAEYGAFRQRWATGIEIEYDENGKPRDPGFDIGADRIVRAEDVETKFGEFTATDLTNYIKGVESDVTHLAAISKTPPHYLLGAIVNASGDALKAAETGLVSKVRDRQAFLGEDWEEVIRLALAAIGDPRADDLAAEVIWKDPETRSEGELVDALVKMAGLGVPREVLWRRWGASPQDIAMWKTMATEQALIDALAVQPAIPQPAIAPPAPPAPVTIGV